MIFKLNEQDWIQRTSGTVRRQYEDHDVKELHVSEFRAKEEGVLARIGGEIASRP
jgi:hypothetical protein